MTRQPMTSDEIKALAATVAAAIAVVAVLLLCKLSFDPSLLRQPPRPMTEVVEQDDEFVEFFEQPVPKGPSSQAYAPVERTAEAHGADATGTDLADAGEMAPAMPDVVSEQPAPIQKPKKEKPQKTGPTQQELEAEARRKARKGIADAFRTKPEANDNTNANGTTPGDAGKPDATTSAVDGTGTGSVGGGWIMPKYAKVKTGQTGRIDLLAVIDASGQVIKIEQTGGKAPAGADPALVAKCIAEVRRHTFTRSDNNAPPSATARISYIFR